MTEQLRTFQKQFIKGALAPGVDVAALSIPRGNGKSWLAAHLLRRCLSNLPFNELTEGFGSERLTGALLYRLTHHVHILEMNGESYRLKCSRENAQPPAPDDPDEE